MTSVVLFRSIPRTGYPINVIPEPLYLDYQLCSLWNFQDPKWVFSLNVWQGNDNTGQVKW